MCSSKAPPLRPRVLLAKPGMDGHNRGVNVIRRALIDAGCEVVYLGIRRSPEQIASVAIQEDVDIVGLSILSGAHLELTSEVISALEERDATGIRIIVGGIIPEDDHPDLHALGVSQVFTPGTTLREIEAIVLSLAQSRRDAADSVQEQSMVEATDEQHAIQRDKADKTRGIGNSGDH